MNTDMDLRVVMDTRELPWMESPEPGVKRRMLDRVGNEVARATSVVCYEQGAQFPQHRHPGGEEILVLEGTFSDETGDYGPGYYLRNPPDSVHTPTSTTGCLLFVKLWQFSSQDRETIRIQTRTAQWYQGLVPGLSVLPLHEHGGVSTALVRWAPHTQFHPHVHPGGEEILVLEGVFHDEWGSYPQGTWIRSPSYSRHQPHTESEGALIYVKTGHMGADMVPYVSMTLP
ncbi:MAG: cupin [Ferrovum sp.]|nr:cupin [Ferrovum sp.]NDU87641.1 cupin [Ferrovum sp.]